MLKGQLSEEDRREIVKYRLEKADRHIMDMDTEVMPLVKPAKGVIEMASEMARKQLCI